MSCFSQPTASVDSHGGYLPASASSPGRLTMVANNGNGIPIALAHVLACYAPPPQMWSSGCRSLSPPLLLPNSSLATLAMTDGWVCEFERRWRNACAFSPWPRLVLIGRSHLGLAQQPARKLDSARKGHTVARSSKFHSVGFKFFIGNVHIFVVIDRNV